jgi:nitrogen regulatory protein PII
MEQKNSLILFQGKGVKRIWHKNEWYFSVVDVIEILTNSSDSKQYIKKMRNRDPELNSYWGTICTPLELLAPDGKRRKTNCVSVKGAFKIIQSIRSKKAEPFKRWLAQIGHERIQEIENPELAQRRMKEIYKAKGYSDDWIEKRVRGIAVRDELTDEWKKKEIMRFSQLKCQKPPAIDGWHPGKHKVFPGYRRASLSQYVGRSLASHPVSMVVFEHSQYSTNK